MLKYKINYSEVVLWTFVVTVILWVYPFLFGQYVDSFFPYIPQEQIPFSLIRLQGASSNNSGRNYCPSFSPLLKGMDFHAYELLEEEKKSSKNPASVPAIQAGGVWQPRVCQAKFQSVIIVPYRDRPKQLQIFLDYMHPFLQRQQLHYRIMVVEQADKGPFNRARLLNIGFVEAMKLGEPNYCFIFHDVDLLPLNDYNIYACTHHPRHMYSAVDIFRFHLPYRSLAGGAFAILARHFEAVNGHSNIFKGWGGEDDDFSRRLRRKGLIFQRFDPRLARYLMIPHQHETRSKERWKMLSKNERRNLSEDGLSTLTYEVLRFKQFPRHTHLYVK